MVGSRANWRRGATTAVWMERALRLAARGAGDTAPNPMVGAVVVRDGHRVGEGYHHAAGQPHAERLALAQAGRRARGATLYCTLEPCHHTGRTPPCTEAIIAAGVARVVIAMVDPDRRVRGRGVQALQAAGLSVEVGPGGRAAAHLNRWYVTARTLGRPRVLYKWAETLDGAVATATGDARWVSGRAARAEAHRWRARLDAVLVGVGTVLADDPLLTVRLAHGRNPLRVIADRQARTPPGARALPALICVGPQAPAERVAALRAAGADVVMAPTPATILAELAGRGCLGVLLEGGPSLAGAFWRAGLIDEVAVAIAPRILGPGRSPLAGPEPERLSAAQGLRDLRVRRLGPDLWVSGMVR